VEGFPLVGENENLSRGERLQIMLSPEELEAVDDFRFKRRMPSRAAAVRELFRIGLANADAMGPVAGKKSSEFGVLEAEDKRNKRADGR
jgi:hypothetical protein